MEDLFRAINGFVTNWVGGWERLTAFIAAGGGLILIGLFLRNFWRSYRLLRLYHLGERRGSCLAALGRLLLIMLANPVSVIRARSLFKRARMQLEYEAINERPKPVINERDTPMEERYAARLRDWRVGLHKLFDRASKETITVATPAQLHARFEAVERYFDSLEHLGLGKDERQFETKIKIKTGFVAPLHLVAGVLRKFGDDWEKVLSVYEQDRFTFSAAVGQDTQRTLERMREIQLFIFDCWLLWGPSIPICHSHCGHFGGGWSSLQYGYGDENNSVEIVGTNEFLIAQWNALSPPAGIRAVSASVLGHIANSRFLDREEAGERMGKAIAKSWNADDDGRLLVLVSEEEHQRGADRETHAVREVRVSDTGALSLGNTGDSYYSAYLWAIFVILREEPGAATLSERVWTPVHPDPQNPRRSVRPWLDFFPFFEHGNIADRETYAFLKHQLAEKAISGLAKLVVGGNGLSGEAASAAAKAYSLRFAFACSIDETGCGHAMRFEANSAAGQSGFPADALPDLMWRQVRERFPYLADIVMFDYYDSAVHPHSACSLPHDIGGYFEHMS